jgi:hypothetical protein
MIEHGIEEKFIKPRARELYFVAQTVEAAVEHFRSYRLPVLADKWFKPEGAASAAP